MKILRIGGDKRLEEDGNGGGKNADESFINKFDN